MPIQVQKTATAYVALGSNLGDRQTHLCDALQALAQLGTVTARSFFYETDPVGNISQPDFLNAVAELTTGLPPVELMGALLRIEQQHGRERGSSPPKGPRTLDLDLLSYDNLVLATPLLTLPHPELTQRGFVLVPLAEIAPQWRHPVSGKAVSYLLDELSESTGTQLPGVHKIARLT